MAANVIKREIAVISSRFSPSKSNSPRSPAHAASNFPNLYNNIGTPGVPPVKILKPKNHKFLKYSSNKDAYDQKLFGFPPEKTTRSSIKRYSPYRHSSMSIEQSGENESLINLQVLSHYANQKEKWSFIKQDLNKTIEDFKLGSGHGSSIDYAERDVSAAGSPLLQSTIAEFPAESSSDFETVPKRDFDRLLMMSQRRMQYEKYKKEKRVTGRVIVKNTNMYTKWKGELRRVPDNELFKRYLD